MIEICLKGSLEKFVFVFFKEFVCVCVCVCVCVHMSDTLLDIADSRDPDRHDVCPRGVHTLGISH